MTVTSWKNLVEAWETGLCHHEKIWLSAGMTGLWHLENFGSNWCDRNVSSWEHKTLGGRVRVSEHLGWGTCIISISKQGWNKQSLAAGRTLFPYSGSYSYPLWPACYTRLTGNFCISHSYPTVAITVPCFSYSHHNECKFVVVFYDIDESIGNCLQTDSTPMMASYYYFSHSKESTNIAIWPKNLSNPGVKAPSPDPHPITVAFPPALVPTYLLHFWHNSLPM